MSPCRILVVDDDDDVRESLRTLLELHGHEVHEAADGPTAVAKAAETQPDVVFLDIGMPALDGFAVATQLRGASRPQPFIVALTGYGQESFQDRARRGGFDAYILKPADVDELLRLLERVCGDVAARGSARK